MWTHCKTQARCLSCHQPVLKFRFRCGSRAGEQPKSKSCCSASLVTSWRHLCPLGSAGFSGPVSAVGLTARSPMWRDTTAESWKYWKYADRCCCRWLHVWRHFSSKPTKSGISLGGKIHSGLIFNLNRLVFCSSAPCAIPQVLPVLFVSYLPGEIIKVVEEVYFFLPLCVAISLALVTFWLRSMVIKEQALQC